MSRLSRISRSFSPNFEKGKIISKFLDHVDTPVFDLLIVNYLDNEITFGNVFFLIKIVLDYVLVDFLFLTKKVLSQICNKNSLFNKKCLETEFNNLQFQYTNTKH